MVESAGNSRRRADSLSRERIVAASIEILDERGESGLTFRSLSERLATGPGALYWHIADKSDLMTAACDAVIAGAVVAPPAGTSPQEAIGAIAAAMFDAMDAHPWIGSALMQAPGQLPIVRILEPLGAQIGVLGVAEEDRWIALSALVSYILGVGGQNAANGQFARMKGLDRSDFLDEVATAWSRLDAESYPVTRSLAGQMRVHDDRADFLAGIDVIVGGIAGLPTK